MYEISFIKITQTHRKILARLDGIDENLARLEGMVHQLMQIVTKGATKVMASLDALTAQVTKNTDVEASAIVLIKNIAAALEAAKTDPVAIAALAAQLDTSATALAEAIVANTPAA